MLLPWMLLCSLQILLHASYGGDIDFRNNNWRTECIYDFYTVVEARSIGILYKSESAFKHADFFKSISNNGISSSVFEFPSGNVSDVMSIIMSWKTMGVRHILFLQKLDAKLLSLWLQILDEICDETWWLFYAEEAFRNLFEKIVATRRCLMQRWIVFSSNCSMYEEYNEALQQDCFSESFQNSSSIYFAENKTLNNFYFQDTQNIIRLAVNEMEMSFTRGTRYSIFVLMLEYLLSHCFHLPASPPYLTLKKDINNTVTLGEGPDAEILRMIAEKLGFQYQISESPDGEWGRIKNGKWTGLMGMLTRGEADIAAGCVSITYTRHSATKFSAPYDIQRSVIISKSPSVKSKTYAVLQPFGYDVWLMILFVFIVFFFLLYGIGKAYGKFYSWKTGKLDRLFWYMIGTICSEGGWLTFKVQGNATVLLLGLWLLFVIIMQASYSGTLMSVLTFPTYEHAIDSLHDLASAVMKDGYKCGCLKGTINCDTLLDLRDDLLIIKENLNSDKKNFVHSVREGLDKVLEDKYVFVAQQIGSIYVAQLMPEPNFYMSDESLDIEVFSLPVRKDLPYLTDINKMILRLFEAGLIAKWRDDVISLNNMEFARRKRDVQDIYPLSLEQLTGAIYMFGYGMLFGMVALVFECITSKCFNK